MSLAQLASPLANRALHSVGRAQYLALTSVVRTLVGAREQVTVLDGTRVPFFYRPSKSGEPPLLLVHGFGGDKEGWLLFASCLARSRGLIIPDLPGFGAAGGITRDRASARAQAAILAGLLGALGVPRAHLVGNSMGGGISLRLAEDRPELVASLTLIGSVGPVVEKSVVGHAFDRGENPLIVESPEDMERLLGLVAERLPPSPRALRRYLAHERFSRRDAEAELFHGWVGASPADGVPTELAAITARALVLHGDRDKVIHVSTARALAQQLPNATLQVFDGIGHVPQLEAPKKTAKALEGFLDGLAS
jgi:abhydrolase domain-containing protein 6